jgi:hypothetical protein
LSINQDTWMICQPLRSTNRSPPCVDSRPPAHRAGTPHIALTRRAPRRLRRRPRRERSASRSSLTSQIHSSPSSDGSTGKSQAPPWPSGPGVCRGRPARACLPGYAGIRGIRAPRPILPPYAPCHALWSLPPSGGFAAAASPRALRASGCAAALRARQTSPHRDRRDLRMGYPLSRSQILCSSALQRVACLPGSGCQTDLARTAAAA